ncbi:MAG: hypothetical protein U9O59_01780 [Actinomycetota bacterium]|nr:hypothetical protein [Actinomycetota bacterium]
MDAKSSVILTKRVTITSPNPVVKEDFIDKMGEISSNIVKFLKKNGCSKLGHIKFISTTDGEDYLQLSVLDMKDKPQINGILKKTFGKIKLTFNIIEFGVARELVENKVSEEIKNIQEYFNNN